MRTRTLARLTALLVALTGLACGATVRLPNELEDARPAGEESPTDAAVDPAPSPARIKETPRHPAAWPTVPDAPADDTTAPTITAFSLPATHDALRLTTITLTASDDVGVTGYLVTASPEAPSLVGTEWSATPPTELVFPRDGAHTLYAWARDAAGNLSSARSAVVSIRLPPPLDLVPLWEVISSEGGNRDAFYSIDYSEATYADGIGYGTPSVVAWVPCSTNGQAGPSGQSAAGRASDFGYAGIPMGFACAPPTGAAPLFRLYKAFPASDHFMTTSVSEAAGAIELGYTFEKVEGYLFTSQRVGTQPVYRLSRCVFASGEACDVEHRYTTSADTKDTLLAAGADWALDGVAGYAFVSYDNAYAKVVFDGRLNGLSHTSADPRLTTMANVVPTKGEVVIQGSGRAVGSGYMASLSTPRPAGAHAQRLSLVIDTGTLFEPGSNLDHLPIALRFHAQLGSDGVIGRPYDGLGVFLARATWGGGQCGDTSSGGQVFVEGFQNAKFVECAPLAVPLQSAHTYRLELTVTDDGWLHYEVTDLDATSAPVQAFSRYYGHGFTTTTYACPLAPAPGALTPDQLHCNNPWSLDRFPTHRSGYAVVPIFAPPNSALPQGATGAFRELTVEWLDASGAVLVSY